MNSKERLKLVQTLKCRIRSAMTIAVFADIWWVVGILFTDFEMDNLIVSTIFDVMCVVQGIVPLAIFLKWNPEVSTYTP